MENNIKVGTTFYVHNLKDTIYTISKIDSNNVEISWHRNSKEFSTEYTLTNVLKFIKDKIWIITMEKEIMEKKIIGYKLIKPEFKVPAQEIMQTIFSTDLEVTVEVCIYRLKDAGVLDLWFEPVYEEEEKFKVGDWITCDGKDSFCSLGQFVEIAKIEGDKFWIYYTPKKFEDFHNYRFSCYKHLRKATEEEIKKAQIIEIGGYEVKFLNKESCVINGIEYIKTHLVVLRYLMNKNQIKSLNVGCSGQYKVDLPLLEKIIDKF
jgi:hypothetical protein